MKSFENLEYCVYAYNLINMTDIQLSRINASIPLITPCNNYKTHLVICLESWSLLPLVREYIRFLNISQHFSMQPLGKLTRGQTLSHSASCTASRRVPTKSVLAISLFRSRHVPKKSLFIIPRLLPRRSFRY